MIDADLPWWQTPLSHNTTAIMFAVIGGVFAISLSRGPVSLAINLVAAALFAWAFVPEPSPVYIAVCAVLPWLAIIATTASGGRLQFMQDANDKDARPDASVLIGVPALSLFMAFVLMDAELTDATWAAATGAVSAVVMTALVLAVRRPAPPRRRISKPRLPTWTPWLETKPYSKWDKLFVFVMWTGLYGFAASAFGNMLLDTSPAQTYAVAITEKRVVRGRDEVTLAPWALDPKSRRHQIPEDLFKALKTGDTICITSHPGRFGWRWQKLHPCPPRSP